MLRVFSRHESPLWTVVYAGQWLIGASSQSCPNFFARLWLNRASRRGTEIAFVATTCSIFLILSGIVSLAILPQSTRSNTRFWFGDSSRLKTCNNGYFLLHSIIQLNAINCYTIFTFSGTTCILICCPHLLFCPDSWTAKLILQNDIIDLWPKSHIRPGKYVQVICGKVVKNCKITNRRSGWSGRCELWLFYIDTILYNINTYVNMTLSFLS